MNDRIKDIALETIVTYAASDAWVFTDAEFDKFCEMVIKECVNAADEWYQHGNEIHWDPGQHIKNHFGVE